MTLDPKQQEEYNRLLREGIELAKKLGDEISEVNFRNMPEDLKAGENELKSLKLQVTALKKEWNEFNIDVGIVHTSFVKIVEELKNTTKGVSLTTNAFNGLTSIAQRLYIIQNGNSEVSLKELRNLKSKTEAKKLELELADKILDEDIKKIEAQQKVRSLSKDESTQLEKMKAAQKAVNDELHQGEKSRLTLLDQLNREIDKQEQLNKKIGLTGSLIKGISKIPFLGDAVDTDRALEAATLKAKETNSAFSAMKAGLSSVGKDIKGALTDPLAVAGFLGMQLFKTFLSVDKQTGDLAKGFNLSYREASNLRTELNETANATNDLNVTTKGLQESLVAVGNTLGSNAILNNKDLVTMTKLRDQVGLANEELVEMEKLTLATGGNLEKNTTDLLYAAKITSLNNGVLLNEKQIMQEVSKASNATKLSLGGSAEQLGKAAAQAKALGMNLEQVDKIASAMLEIESSITNELEAELLTGKELNLEQARLYALNNDMVGLSKEIAKNFGSVAEFGKMNRIQQEAAAKAVGMSREELAATLTDQAALQGLSGKQAENAKAALAAARAKGMSEEEIKKQGIDGLMQQQSIQEKLLATVEKLKEVFVTLIEPLMPLINILSNVLGIVGKIVKFTGDWGKYILGAAAAMKILSVITKKNLMLSMGEAAMKAIGAESAIPIIGPALGLAIAASILALGSKFLTGNDVVSPGGYGKRTLMGPEGAIALNDKDTVIAGTKLFGNDVKSTPGEPTKMLEAGKINIANSNKTTNQNTTSTQTTNIDISPIVAELAAVKAVLNQILGKEGAVYLDSTKVGTTLSVGTSRIQ